MEEQDLAQEEPQLAFLKAAKEELDVTWDVLAKMAGIQPRALKTYRMPTTSQDHRPIPSLARDAIQRVIQEHRKKAKRAAAKKPADAPSSSKQG